MIDRFFELACQPFAYGMNDCCTVPADCVAGHYGRDLMATWRGRYSTALGLERIIRRGGFDGFETAFADTMEKQGLAETDQAADWAIGLIGFAVDGKPMTAPAFCMDGWWHGRGHDGPVVLKRALRIWR